jgi:hypothetical protein
MMMVVITGHGNQSSGGEGRSVQVSRYATYTIQFVEPANKIKSGNFKTCHISTQYSDFVGLLDSFSHRKHSLTCFQFKDVI